MKKLYLFEIEEEAYGPQIALSVYEVFGETEKQYQCRQGVGDKIKRVMKSFVDREHGVVGGGRWYTTEELGWLSLCRYHGDMAMRHRQISETAYRELMR